MRELSSKTVVSPVAALQQFGFYIALQQCQADFGAMLR
jgi:hypothetical protein